MYGEVMFGVCAFALAAVIAGIIFSRILGAYIEGSISGLHCIIVGGLFIGLLICIIMSPASPVNLVYAAIILLIFIALPILRSLSDRKDTHDYYDEKIRAYRAAMEADPRNMAARERLVEALYKQGLLNEAIVVCEELVLRDPANREAEYRLRLLKEEETERISPRKLCPSCGHANAPDRTHCENCEGLMSVSSEFVKWLAHGGAKKITWSSAIALGIVACVGTVLSILSVPGRIVFVALTLLIVIGAEYLYMLRNW
jgi:ribosomal protein S27AE